MCKKIFALRADMHCMNSVKYRLNARFQQTQGIKTQAFFKTQALKLKVSAKTQCTDGCSVQFSKNSNCGMFSIQFVTANSIVSIKPAILCCENWDFWQ